MRNDVSRRAALSVLAGGAALVALAPRGALAFGASEAQSLIDALVGDINSVINSGSSANAMYSRFEQIFAKYADVPIVARSVLGPTARSASSAELNAFTQAFQGYIARKYGRQFRDFIGGTIKVTGAQSLKSFFEVTSVANIPNKKPIDVRWHVSDKSGAPRFFNIIIEGVNMVAQERSEIGALLDKNKGSIPALTKQLSAMG